MTVHCFTFTLADDPRDLLEWSNALYEAGGDDTSPGERDGKLHVSFHREADTLEDALRSARRTVQAAGLRVVSCEIPEAAMAAAWPPSRP